MVDYVFDTEPLVAFLYNEPGHASVASVLAEVDAGERTGALAAVNASELLYVVARIEGDDGVPTTASLRTADRDVRALTRRGVAIERASWAVAGEVKAHGDGSLADSYAVALAAERDATLLVGGDDDFGSLPVDVELERIRDHAV